MNVEDKILELMNKNKGLITTKDIVSKNINRIYLTRLVKKGKIERIKKGLYVLPSSWGDEYYNIIYRNNAVYSYETALYFFGLCEAVPATYNITVPRGYNGSLKTKEKVKLHYVKKELMDLGRKEIKSPQGQMISVYNPERCICDMLRKKEEQDKETLKYVLTEYLNDRTKRDVPKLVEYSKKIGVYSELDNYLEILS